MNGYALLEEAARLIGLDFNDEKIKIIGLTLVNTALLDLGFAKIQGLGNPLGISNQKAEQALKFCLAALISNAVGDSATAENMSRIYGAQKAEIKSKTDRVREAFPQGEW
ncbi:MAG: hypothetical protein J6Q74_00690 [Clostridia bacterium]|nr:hypothetical protein [Clostridia bacterium]